MGLNCRPLNAMKRKQEQNRRGTWKEDLYKDENEKRSEYTTNSCYRHLQYHSPLPYNRYSAQHSPTEYDSEPRACVGCSFGPNRYTTKLVIEQGKRNTYHIFWSFLACLEEYFPIK